MSDVGFGPKRELSKNDNGTYTLKVTPQIRGACAYQIALTEDQAARFRIWQRTRVPIRSMLPELTPTQHDIILSNEGVVINGYEFSETRPS